MDRRVVFPVHTDHPFGFGQENGITVFIVSNLIAFQADKLFHRRLFVGGEPART
ncbi:hypothetical protein D3C87_2056250 [compost metagenome]